MAQETKVIDIRRSFIPRDPNAFFPTYHATEGEDQPEPRVPIIAYDGYNFMPTADGYASYFGKNSTLGISTLVTSGGTGKVDDLFMIQTNLLENILVALCDDGIWTKSASSSGNWTHVVTLTPPLIDGLHLQWSKCVIENAIYVYRQGENSVYVASSANGFVFTGFTPTFLNMVGQLGIFKAGGRLGFWDSENSIAWSALGDPTNVTPDLKTLAGATIFQDIVGRIVVVHQHGTGFIVYCTRSIVHVTRNLQSPMIWSGNAIFNSNGISYREEATFAEPDTKHYAYTTQGIVEIANGRAEFVIPEISTYLKEKRKPVYIKIMNGRYLFFPILDESYLAGLVKFTSEDFGTIDQTWQGASYNVDNFEVLCKSYNAIDRQSREVHLFNTFGYTRCGQAIVDGQVRKYRDNLSTTISLANLSNFKSNGIDPNFNTNGAIVAIDATTKYFLPNVLLQPISTFDDIIHQEDNTNNFYKKQEMLWTWENFFTSEWIKAILAKSYAPITNTVLKAVPYNPTIQTVERDITNFGPYVLPSFESESNRYYGKAAKSQWLQRSLCQTLQIQVISEIKYAANALREARWEEIDFPITGVIFTKFGDLMNSANFLDKMNTISHELDAFKPFTGVTYQAHPAASGTIRTVVTYSGSGGGSTNLNWTAIDPGADIADIPANLSGQGIGTGIYPVWVIDGNRTQTFKQNLQFTEAAPCTYKQLGFTDIVGHGKFDNNCVFTLTDSNPEAADYTDVCITDPNPPRRKQPQILNSYFSWQDIVCGQFDVIVNAVTYSYPDISLTIPGGTILLQQGSIEPIYPTFLGAFVYDTQYKKWGKMQQNYKQLLDYFPINNVAGDAPIPYDVFLPKGAMLLPAQSLVTNIAIRSEEFNLGFSTNNVTVTPNTDIDPNGFLTADRITENGVNGQHYIDQAANLDPSTFYTWSAYVKRGTSGTRDVELFFYSNTGADSVFVAVNPSTGVITSGPTAVGFTNPSVVVIPDKNGYFRVALTAKTGVVAGASGLRLGLCNGATVSYIGDTTSNNVFWGAQMQLGALVTKYISTGAAAVSSDYADIALFDQFPSDSRIIFGKLGLYRKGFTDLHEVRIQNRNPMSGTIVAEGSLDGKNVESWLNQAQAFADATQVTANLNLSARWFNLIIEGNYDLIAMEARASRTGKR